MNLLKIITYINWVVIAILGILVAAETLFPAKGGDAAGRGMGQAIYYLAIIALVLLAGLNLLPYKWAKYTAFGLVAVPILFAVISPIVSNLKRKAGYMVNASQPIFLDNERDQVAKAVRDGKPEKLKELLKTPVPKLNQDGELLAYAVYQTSGTAYRPTEKLECLGLLFEAGAKLDSAGTDGIPIHLSVADNGDAAVLRLLLAHGADANAVQKYANRPILFEAIGSYQNPEAAVRVLLEFGADPNSTALFDDENGPVSPLLRAAQLERWGICVALLEQGANVDFKSNKGKELRDFIPDTSTKYPKEGYSTQADFERFRGMLKGF